MTNNPNTESRIRPRSVLFIDTLKFWGGGEHQFLQCAQGLQRRGYDVAIAAREDAPLYRRADESGIPVVGLRGQSDFSMGDARKLRKWLGAHPGAAVILATTRDAKLTTMATLGNRFDASVFWMMGSLVLRDRRRDRALASELVNRFIVPSRSLSLELESLDYVNPNQIVVLPNGLDLSAWPKPDTDDSTLTQDNSPNPIVGVFSRLDKRKGIDTLLDAWPQILAAHPGAKLWIVGTGPEEAALRGQSDGLQESVKLHGYSDNVRELMLQVDIVVQPSRYEPFGIVLLEAMSCAKPVVCTSVGGMVEFIDDACGIVVAPESPIDLAKAISNLLSDHQRARNLGKAGRKRLEDRFSLEQMTDALEMIIAKR